ncbi:hypothetical protein MTR67_022565 [Solanum verrucosum]|uniref:RNase H type-1 domain-containing protein n=1 Tax=Solanum verrucosum TaxID=315347 RepID=A0AAF0QUW5_SOLVR|nr:hypothetical protein MTR67_022565 [Solanum verrucosum]
MCGCYEVPVRETVEHLFLQGKTTSTVWAYFSKAAGLLGPWIQVKQVIRKRWDTHGNPRQKRVYQAIPNVNLWFLWRMRNTLLRGGAYTIKKVIWDISNTIKNFIEMKFKCTIIPNTWPQMVALLEVYRPVFQTQVVRWLMPPVGWWKCNTDGASRGNPGPSAAAFCIRNSTGDLVGAKGVKIQDSTSIVAEAIVVREGLQ